MIASSKLTNSSFSKSTSCDSTSTINSPDDRKKGPITSITTSLSKGLMKLKSFNSLSNDSYDNKSDKLSDKASEKSSKKYTRRVSFNSIVTVVASTDENETVDDMNLFSYSNDSSESLDSNISFNNSFYDIISTNLTLSPTTVVQPSPPKIRSPSPPTSRSSSPPNIRSPSPPTSPSPSSPDKKSLRLPKAKSTNSLITCNDNLNSSPRIYHSLSNNSITNVSPKKNKKGKKQKSKLDPVNKPEVSCTDLSACMTC